MLTTGAALSGLLLAAACTEISPRTSLPPQSRPEGLAPPPSERKVSARSADLAGYYRTIQTNLLTQGLLRTDGGGADTPFALLEETSDDGAVFGETSGLVRSAAYVRINAGDNLPVGILALGARERGAFHPGQGSDLVNFLARVAELCLRRWLSKG